MKTCTKCGAMKPVGAFSKDAQKADGLRSSCRECKAAENAAHRKMYGARIKATLAAWYLRNKERVRANQMAWRAANPKLASAIEARWKRFNPASVAASCERHRVLKRDAPGDGVSANQWKIVLADSMGLCAYCSERKPLTMDHVDPLSRGGAHDVTNVVPACASCNASKGNKTLLTWLALRAA